MVAVKMISERLRERRERAGLTQGQVSKYEGISRSYVSNLERGQNDPEVWDLLARLAKRYRTSADYLLGLTDDPRPSAGRVVAEERAPYIVITEKQRAVLDFFDSLSDDEREFVLRLLSRFGGGDTSALADS